MLVTAKSIRRTAFYVQKPVISYWYVHGYVILYASWVISFTKELLFEQTEFYYLTLGFLMTMNALTVLSCHWSVSIKAFLTCRKVWHTGKKSKIYDFLEIDNECE